MSDELESLLAPLPSRSSNVVPLGLPGATTPGEEVSSWTPVTLSGNMRPTDPPTLLRVAGGRPLLYPGKTHSIVGESSSGKTWLAVLVAGEVLEDGGRVLWLDYESNAREFTERLKAMRDVPDEWWSRVHYLNPSHQLWNHRENKATAHEVAFTRLLEGNTYELVVIDSWTGAMACEGLDTNSDSDVDKFLQRLPNRLANVGGSAVVLLDHVVKNKETRGFDARGSGRKREGLTGASYLMRVESPWCRAETEPVTGAFTLTVAKDRGGTRAMGDKVATGVVTSDPDGGLRITLSRSEDTVVMPRLETLQAIVEHLRRFPGLSKSKLEAEVEGKARTIRHAVEWLIDRQVVTVTKSGVSHLLTLDEVMLTGADIL